VDYLKVDGCGDASQYVHVTFHLKSRDLLLMSRVTAIGRYAGGYARMGLALQSSGRGIVYSCAFHFQFSSLYPYLRALIRDRCCHLLSSFVPAGSWPAYVGDDETKKPFDTYIQGFPPVPFQQSSYTDISFPLTLSSSSSSSSSFFFSFFSSDAQTDATFGAIGTTSSAAGTAW
jgi:hypothetical protein